jgi:hypothetical protein
MSTVDQWLDKNLASHRIAHFGVEVNIDLTGQGLETGTRNLVRAAIPAQVFKRVELSCD